MTKSILLAALLAVTASAAFAQSDAASAPAPAASSAKKKWLHAPKLRKGATAASNPEASADKKGGS